MGYDMYHEVKPAGEVAAYDQAYAKFQAKVKRRDAFPRDSAAHEAAQKEVDEAYDQMGKAEAYYFRLNIFGMGKYRSAMEELGMLDNVARAPGQRAWDSLSEDDEEGYEKLRTRTVTHPRGLPRYKFGSNDGWLITPEEIRAALANYKKPGHRWFKEREIEEDYWDEWIQFLQRAIERGGFRVW